MTIAAARKRIIEMENEYAYSPTWPVRYQREFEALCEIIHGSGSPKKTKQVKL